MPVTVVVGGQYGSEGKGKVAFEWARLTKAEIAIRVGGPNSGHTVIDQDGKPVTFRQLPTAALLKNIHCIIPAGAYVDPGVLIDEIKIAGISPDRLSIDPNAAIVTQRERDEEAISGLRDRIGSTLSGTGAAVLRRVSRDGSIVAARDCTEIKEFVRPIASILREMLQGGARAIIEGTQGFGLSLLHTPHYPKATSRDTTAAAFVSESGISPLDVDQVVMVIRTYPIRVAGDSGPLLNETSWEAIGQTSGYGPLLSERTSVTKNIRRVGEFDPQIVRAALDANNPSTLVLNHVDYFDASCRTTNRPSALALGEIRAIEKSIGRKIDFLGCGPSSMVSRQHRALTELAS